MSFDMHPKLESLEYLRLKMNNDMEIVWNLGSKQVNLNS